MTRAVATVSNVATSIGVIPLLWLAWLHFRKCDPGVAWWWLAGAFAVSWIADTAAHWVNPWLISPLYLITQGSLVGFVFLDRKDDKVLILTLGVTAMAAALWKGLSAPDVLLHTVAWLSIVGIVWNLPQLDRLRTSLLVYFGLGWFCWMGYAYTPGWYSWSIYQTVRLTGILLFCWAVSSPRPRFRLAR